MDTPRVIRCVRVDGVEDIDPRVRVGGNPRGDICWESRELAAGNREKNPGGVSNPAFLFTTTT
jgi:hypothetical protein